MSPFAIFAIVLTIAYVIYYAVIIHKDINGNIDASRSDEESFDVSSMQDDEASVEVTESEDGYVVGNTDDTTDEPAEQLTPENTSPSPVQQMIQQIEETEEEISPKFSVEVTHEQYLDLLLLGTPNPSGVKVERVKY